MIYGYARVSTKKQAKEGNSLEAQEKLLMENGRNNSQRLQIREKSFVLIL